MTRDEEIVLDVLLEAGYSRRQARSMLAVGRPLYAKLRAKRRDLHGIHLDATRQMRAVMDARPDEDHTDHCWARIAWGDGECECNEMRCLERGCDQRRASNSAYCWEHKFNGPGHGAG